MYNKILRLPQVMEVTGLSRSSIYSLVKQGIMPRPLNIGGGRARGWLADEIDEWITERAQLRDQEGGQNAD